MAVKVAPSHLITQQSTLISLEDVGAQAIT